MRVAVIGGGIGGLAAAHELLRGGGDPLVLDEGARPGGKVGTREERGYLSEDGPNFLARPMDAVLDACGLRADVVSPEGSQVRWVHLDGRVFRAPSLPLLARAGVGRALLEPLLAKPLRGDPSLADFLVERFGRRAGGLAAAVMSAGVYAGDPAALSARDAFPNLAALAEKGSLIVNAFRRPKAPRTGIWSLRRGLGSLAEALARSLSGRVRSGVRVTRLAPAGGGWSVEGERFDAVVLAIPAAAAAELTRGFAPAFAAGARQLRNAPVTVVHLGLGAAAVPRGFGMIDASGTLAASGTLLPSSMLPGRAPEGRALVTAICGGARHPDRAALPDRELVERVLSNLRDLWGVREHPDYVRVVRWTTGIAQYEVGHRERVRALRESLRGLPPIELAGASYDGVAVPDVARSGAAAAARLSSR